MTCFTPQLKMVIELITTYSLYQHIIVKLFTFIDHKSTEEISSLRTINTIFQPRRQRK